MDLRENRAMELESGIAAFETKNFAHATKLLSPIAEEGNPDAMYRMAIMLQNGLGCLANEDKAFSYMKKAAENGLPLAMHALVLCILRENVQKRILNYVLSGLSEQQMKG